MNATRNLIKFIVILLVASVIIYMSFQQITQSEHNSFQETATTYGEQSQNILPLPTAKQTANEQQQMRTYYITQYGEEAVLLVEQRTEKFIRAVIERGDLSIYPHAITEKALVDITRLTTPQDDSIKREIQGFHIGAVHLQQEDIDQQLMRYQVVVTEYISDGERVNEANYIYNVQFMLLDDEWKLVEMTVV